jgi:hypothetical protein
MRLLDLEGGVIVVEEDAEDIPAVGPSMEMGHAAHAVLWQDALDSLPTAAADPEVDCVGPPKEVSVAALGGTRVGMEPVVCPGRAEEALAATFGGAGGSKVRTTEVVDSCAGVVVLEDGSMTSGSTPLLSH